MDKILVAIAVGIVFGLVVLLLGLYTLWKGGDTARSWSNKLMRLQRPGPVHCHRHHHGRALSSPALTSGIELWCPRRLKSAPKRARARNIFQE